MAQYGDQMRQTDEYGNPVRETGDKMGQYGTGFGTTGAHGTQGGVEPGAFDTGLGGQQHGQLRRSGSSGSSSSEDDGMGGRRKKGLKEKIKEKLPGGHKDEQQSYGTRTDAMGGGYGQSYGTQTGAPGEGYGYAEGQTQEKKGMMEKIKEKLPGGGR